MLDHAMLKTATCKKVWQLLPDLFLLSKMNPLVTLLHTRQPRTKPWQSHTPHICTRFQRQHEPQEKKQNGGVEEEYDIKSPKLNGCDPAWPYCQPRTISINVDWIVSESAPPGARPASQRQLLVQWCPRLDPPALSGISQPFSSLTSHHSWYRHTRALM